MSDLFSENEPSKCNFSDCCRFIVDLRNSAPNPFEHMNTHEMDLILAEIISCSHLIRKNKDLLDSLEQSEISDLTRALYSLTEQVKEKKRYE